MKLLNIVVMVLVMVLFSSSAFAGLESVVESFPAWVTTLTSVVTVATVVTSMTPSKSDDVIINKVLWVLNILSGNVGKNKNADAVENNSKAGANTRQRP